MGLAGGDGGGGGEMDGWIHQSIKRWQDKYILIGGRRKDDSVEWSGVVAWVDRPKWETLWAEEDTRISTEKRKKWRRYPQRFYLVRQDLIYPALSSRTSFRVKCVKLESSQGPRASLDLIITATSHGKSLNDRYFSSKR